MIYTIITIYRIGYKLHTFVIVMNRKIKIKFKLIRKVRNVTFQLPCYYHCKQKVSHIYLKAKGKEASVMICGSKIE